MNETTATDVRPGTGAFTVRDMPVPDAGPFASEEEFIRELTANQHAILAFLTSLMPGDPAADDVLQQTNMTLWRKRETYRANTNFRAWAFECAKWTLRAHLKQQQRKNWLVVDEELTRAVTERMIERIPPAPGEAQAALRNCLSKLREADRDLLLCYYEEGSSLGRCASLTGRSAASLKVSLFRLRAALRRCITGRLAVVRAES